MIELSRDGKRQCSLADPDNLKTQAHKFLGIWCTKSGWRILEELPVKLEEAALPDMAEKATREIFSEILIDFNYAKENMQCLHEHEYSIYKHLQGSALSMIAKEIVAF